MDWSHAAHSHARALWPVWLVLCLSVAMGLAFHGCTQQGPLSPAMTDHKALLGLAVTVGVGRVLSQHRSLAPLVYRLAQDVRTLTAGPLDVTQLVPTIRGRIAALSLAPEDTLLLMSVADVVAEEVHAYVHQAQLLPEQVRLVVTELAGWIEEAALVYLGGRAPQS